MFGDLETADEETIKQDVVPEKKSQTCFELYWKNQLRMGEICTPLQVLKAFSESYFNI